MLLHSKPVYLGLFLFCSFSMRGHSEGLEKTIGMLNSEFKNFRISRHITSKESIEAFKYEFPLQGLESDSKQNLTGVIFYLKKSGEIVLIQPSVVKYLLPDQKAVNDAVNSNQKASEFFTNHQIENLSDIQVYGLLSKWASAVLSRKDEAIPDLDLTKAQNEKILNALNRRIKLPLLNDEKTQGNVVKIERFAKEVLQLELY
jgi:hypothetical protein